ncbi:MAG: D-alanyl-D-alanine carboxypeptidase/D-alanyl-D-alanine-endopeptidase [Bdellovibrionales bacterium]|nr:D-alanyl-D-alanine carboxypeptidase/D-alanyl-D-alanine-endopeptidase [Bdellovibrionales bacterium]
MLFYLPLCLMSFVFSTELSAASLDHMIQKSGLQKNHLAIWAADADSKKVLWAHRADIQVEPASLTKIMTAVAALSRLGANRKFETSVFTDEPGAEVDSLTLVGKGDPSLVSEHFWTLANSIKESGLKRIRKSIIVDDSHFDRIRFDEDRESKRVDRAYDAPVGGLSFNWNSTNIFVRPGALLKAPGFVFLDPAMESYLTLSNKSQTATKTAIEASRQSTNDGDLIEVRGPIAVGAPEKVIYKSISKPEFWTGHQLRAFLSRAGIEVPPVVTAGALQHKHLRASIQGLRVADQVLSMMKFSSNYVAEMLTKQMGVLKKGAPGTMKNGLEEIRSVMDELGLKRAEYAIVNPSGLTDGNKISAQALGHILQKIDGNLSLAPEFQASLPIFGVDGTVKSRLLGTPAAGRIRAKTGLLRLSGVVGLAGYATTASGKKRTFAFIYNKGSELASMDKIKALFDRLCLELATD